MDFDLEQWIKANGWNDGYNSNKRVIMPNSEQQELYDASYEEGVRCELFERTEMSDY